MVTVAPCTTAFVLSTTTPTIVPVEVACAHAAAGANVNTAATSSAARHTNTQTEFKLRNDLRIALDLPQVRISSLFKSTPRNLDTTSPNVSGYLTPLRSFV